MIAEAVVAGELKAPRSIKVASGTEEEAKAEEARAEKTSGLAGVTFSGDNSSNLLPINLEQ